MKKPTIATLPAVARPLLEARLPDWIEARWFTSRQEALALAPGTEIGWFDLRDKDTMRQAITVASETMTWLNSLIAGVDSMPLDVLKARGVKLSNGAGINAITIAEYVVMGMLSIAKGYREVVRAQDRHEWLRSAPGTAELYGSKALILGYGAIGQLVAQRLKPFEVDVTVVRRGPQGPGELGPDQWRSRLGEFDWIILSVPATAETNGMIAASELAAMKSSAVIVNVARGTVIDQPALIKALETGQIGAAFLDVTDPEPLPPEHPLWALPNAHVTMHLSGMSQTRMFERAVDRFLANLERYARGETLTHLVDLDLGY